VAMQMYEHRSPGLEREEGMPAFRQACFLVDSNQVGDKEKKSANYRDKQGVERTRPLGLVA
jgi:hypothetical protein